MIPLNSLADLHRAVEEDRFVVVVQPIVAVDRLEHPPRRFEALSRWRAEDGSLQAPALFLPALEAAGLMPEFDRHIVRKVVRHLASLPRIQDPWDYVAVNVGPQTLSALDFGFFVRQTLRRARVAPSRLCLELTESLPLTGIGPAIRNLQMLRAEGCRAAIDDFGTGFANLAMFRVLPLDVLKLDGKLVRPVLESEHARALVKTLCDMAHACSCVVVAEFVESERLAQELARLGVDYVQGRYTGMGVPL